MAAPPGPRSPMPIQLINWARRPIQYMEMCSRRYGDFFTLHLLVGRRVAMASHPDTIRKIFTSSSTLLHAGDAAAILRPLVGKHSLLLLDGEEHLRERRMMLPPFHGERMKSYASAMRSVTESAVARWKEGDVLTLHEQFQQITLDIILRTVFGVEDTERMRRLGKALTATLAFADHPQVLMSMTPRFLGKRAAFQRQLRIADALLYEEIERRRERESSDDVVGMLMSAVNEDGQKLSDQQLRDELMTLLVAGHETTATSLAWTVERLLSYRDCYERVQVELDEATGGAPVETSHLEQMVYLDAVIKESLRLRPVLPAVARTLQVPMMVHGFELPARTVVGACIYLTHRRPDIYPEPDQFRPERFVGVRPDPYAWLPFGGGVRRCLGMAFALYEMKIVLATLLQHHDLTLAPGTTERMERRTITFAPSHGPVVRIARRRGRN